MKLIGPLLITSLTLYCSVGNAANAKKLECVEDMITYAYTECDSQNGRWRVAVPRSDECQITKPKSPVFGKECGFSCSRGEYLDLDTQKCKSCPPGTFSLGSGVRFDTWAKIPQGFSVSSSSLSFAEYGYHSKVENCTSSFWVGQKDYISSNNDDCTASLSYSVNINNRGSISFTYQYTDDDLIFHFFIQNNQCQTLQTSGKNVFMNTTGTAWKKYEIELEEGSYVLVWKTTGLLLGSKEHLSPVLIKDIEITGVSYTTTCHRCPSGFYSNMDGSHRCLPCPSDTYSESGKRNCTPCDIVNEYAPVASPSCIKRPACTKHDYFETHTACDSNKKTKVLYKWREPKICNGKLKNSVTLPASGLVKDCPPCNAGFYSTKFGECVRCPEGTFSAGNQNCKNCPVGTEPHYGFFYTWWDSLPKNMNVSCLTVHSETCIGKEGWIPRSGMIESSQSETPVAYLILKLATAGFRSFQTTADGKKLYGTVSFVFELSCSKNCVLYLMKAVYGQETQVIGNWHGTKEKQTFSFDVTKNESISLSWAFQKTSDSRQEVHEQVMKDWARIYSITVTNAVDAPADKCDACAAGVNDAGCIPCPAGKHIEPIGSKCVPCPPNTFLPNESIHTRNCSVCGKGTSSNSDATSCENNCTFLSAKSHRTYDFSVLAQPLAVHTPPSFTESGRKYVHVYNFSICGNEGFGTAECIDNKSLSRSLYFEDKVQGMVCRSTLLSGVGTSDRAVSVYSQPVLLASHLYQIYQPNQNSSTSSPDDKLCGGTNFFPKYEGQEHDDVVYEFLSDLIDRKCINGIKVFIHLRCDPTVSVDAKFEMPTKYPDGSCDGCSFFFLWRSIEACPLCTSDDYYSVEGSCVNGVSTVRHLWKSYPKHCKGGVKLPDYVSKPCIDLKFYVEIGILGGAIILIVLFAIACAFWKKSRKLEYKYQKLVMGTGKNGEELPTADSCAISSSESEEDPSDEVMFRKKREKLRQKDSEKIPLNTMHKSVNM